MKNKFGKISVVTAHIISLLVLTGCSTILAQNGNSFGNGCQFPGYVYGGAIGDGILLVEGFKTLSEDGFGSSMLIGYSIVDFPFSLTADTVLLPLSIIRQITEC